MERIDAAVAACPGPATTPAVITLSGSAWWLATDANDEGRAGGWHTGVRPAAVPTRVPGVIQSDFPGYSGVVWFWHRFALPANPHPDGRCLLTFHDVDYYVDAWVNSHHVGSHEGTQDGFCFDVTEAVRPAADNLLALRVVSPFDRVVDGFRRSETPHGGYRDLNTGGILDDVEVSWVPAVRLDDLFVRADPRTGLVQIEATVHNASARRRSARLELAVALAAAGEAIAWQHLQTRVAPGTAVLTAQLQVTQPRRWELNDPWLYRLTASLVTGRGGPGHQRAVRFGFRDFRFADGCFRLNGRRLFWSSAHTGADTPISLRVPCDPGLLRQDLLLLKSLGFTGVRFIATLAQRRQLDLCDEIGLLVYEESHASWLLDPSPELAQRLDRSLAAMVRRDRNHPSVVIWGLLNETFPGPVFDHAQASLPLVRGLDDTRVVMFSSGRFDANDVLNGLQVLRPAGRAAPCLAYNPQPRAISCVTLFRSGEVSAIPGVDGEYAAVRWTAMEDGEYEVEVVFRATGPYTRATVQVHSDDCRVHQATLNQHGSGDQSAWQGRIWLARHQAVYFVVGGRTSAAGAWYELWEHNTSISARVVSSAGTVADLARDFRLAAPAGSPWAYGWLAAGPEPSPSTFTPLTDGQTVANRSGGSLSNPGSRVWEDLLGDQHYYPRGPHRELELARLRHTAIDGKPYFLSEYGVGSGVDLLRLLRHHEQRQAVSAERLGLVRPVLERFLTDWQRLGLDDTFAGPEDFWRQCLARQASLKALGLNALRANPWLVGYGMTGLNDPLEYGEGLTTAFRELKPGTSDAVFEGLYPVRWCTFAEPVSVYRGGVVRLEAVLSTFDAIQPGGYPARFQVLDPDGRRLLDHTLQVTVPDRLPDRPPGFALPVIDRFLTVDGPTGTYRFRVDFQHGVAAAGGECGFQVTDAADLPPVDHPVSVWGEDAEIAAWLQARGVQVRSWSTASDSARVILVAGVPAAGGTPAAWRELWAKVAGGATAVCLCPEAFRRGDEALGWLPLERPGTLQMVSEYTFPQVYPKDEWVKRHPIFAGLPCGGLMDYAVYRELIPDLRFVDPPTPDEAVAGSFRTSHPGAYWCDSLVAVHRYGAGRLILNALRIRQELGRDPIAERLLRNLLRYAGGGGDGPP